MRKIAHKSMKQWLALLLAGALLAGCAPVQSGVDSDLTKLSQGQTEPAPIKGAYLEKDMTEELFGASEKHWILREMRISSDGSLEVITNFGETCVLLRKDEQDYWQRAAEITAPKQQETGFEFLNDHFTITEKGELWSLGRKGNEQYLCRITQQPGQQPKLEQAIPLAGTLKWIHGLPDGRALINTTFSEDPEKGPVHHQLNLYDSDGGILTIELENPVWRAEYENGMLCAFDSEAGKCVYYDAKIGEKIREEVISLPQNSEKGFWSTARPKNGVYTYADRKGLHTMSADGSLAQSFATDRMFALADQYSRLDHVETLADGSCWVIGKRSSQRILPSERNEPKRQQLAEKNFRLYKYWYDPNYQKPDTTELTLWILHDSSALREMVKSFCEAYPEYSVKVEYGEDGFTEGVSLNDLVRALEARIEADNGPDLVVLDGLPGDEFVQKGLLQDLSQPVDVQTLYPGPAHCWQKDGTLYAVPMLFRAELLFTQNEQAEQQLANAQTLTDLLPLLRQKRHFKFFTSEDVFAQIYPSASGMIFSMNKKAVDEEALREFLSVTGEIVKKQNLNEQSSGNVDSDCEIQSIFSFGQIVYGIQSDRKVKSKVFGFPQKAMTPVLSLAVPKNAEHSQQAKQLIQSALELQKNTDVKIYDGFFSVRGVEKAFWEQERKYLEQQGTAFDEVKISPEEAEAILEQLLYPANTDAFLCELVNQEAQKLYQNQQDLETAVQNILQRALEYQNW